MSSVLDAGVLDTRELSLDSESEGCRVLATEASQSHEALAGPGWPTKGVSLPAVGEENTNCRLSDQQVRELRQARAASRERAEADESGQAQPLDWPELGALFGVSEKYAYRLCRGMSRQAAGGPIEPLENPSRAEVLRNFIRCRACGGKHHRHDECQPCQVQWAAIFGRALEKFGWLKGAVAA